MVLFCSKFIDDKTGSGLFAKSTLKPRTNLFKTSQMITCLNEKSHRELCNHCFQPCSSLKRCSRCKHLRYCSEGCQRDNWKVHKAECDLLSSINASHFVPPLIRFCALLASSSEMRSSYKVDGMMKHEYVENEKICQYYPFLLRGVREMCATAAPEKVYALYIKLVVNLFTLEDTQFNEIGSALIPELTKLNHSCDPNCVLSFRGRTAYVTAIREIPEGEQITISYISLPKPFLARRQQLFSQYNFECTCGLCSVQRKKGRDTQLLRECPSCKEHSNPAIDISNNDLQCPSCQSSLLKSVEKTNDVMLKNIATFNSAITTRAQQDIEIMAHLMAETDALILEERWEAALRTGLKATVGLMDWAQSYPSTGLFLAKLGKLQLNQKFSDKSEYLDNYNRALQLFDMSLKCLSLSLSKSHPLLVEVEQFYYSTNEGINSQ